MKPITTTLAKIREHSPCEDGWGDIMGYEGLYKINRKGEVFSLSTQKKIAILTHRDGYKYAILYKDKKRKVFYIHRLLMAVFLYPSSLHVDHIDGNKGNNKLSNLRYCSPVENDAFYRWKNGGIKNYYYCKRRNKWHVRIRIGNHVKHIGYFDTEEKARAAEHKIQAELLIKYFG